VGIPATPTGFGGFVCFRFVNGFTYGDFGSSPFSLHFPLRWRFCQQLALQRVARLIAIMTKEPTQPA
jgi:hypothetical protein